MARKIGVNERGHDIQRCPHCNGEATFVKSEAGVMQGIDEGRIVCLECEITTPRSSRYTALKRWNNRVDAAKYGRNCSISKNKASPI